MLDAIEVKLYAPQLSMTKGQLKQLPVRYQMSRDSIYTSSFICWFYGDTLGREYRHVPHVLCAVTATGPTDTDEIWLFVPQHYKGSDDGTAIEVAGRHIPFALVK